MTFIGSLNQFKARANLTLPQHFWRRKRKIKLMKGKAPRKPSLHEKTAASVLLKLFISSN